MLLTLPVWALAQVEGKAAAREALRYRLGLTGWGDKPLVGVVTRLTAQKGCLAAPHHTVLAGNSHVRLTGWGLHTGPVYLALA